MVVLNRSPEAAVFAEAYEKLAEVQQFADRQGWQDMVKMTLRVAQELWHLSLRYDFSDYDLGVDAELIQLDLAVRIPARHHPDDSLRADLAAEGGLDDLVIAYRADVGGDEAAWKRLLKIAEGLRA